MSIRRLLLLAAVAVVLSLTIILPISLADYIPRAEKRAITKAKFEQIGKAYAQYASKYPTVPRGSARLQKQMQNETFEETFANLRKRRMSYGIGSSYRDAIGVYSCDSRALFGSLEIRKLVVEARAEPAKTTAFLRKQMAEMATKYPAARAKFLALKGPFYIDNDVKALEECRYHSAVALYLLAELKDFESLPMMASNLPAEGEPFDEHDSKVMVSPKWTIYSMHRLISEMPTAGLSTEARESRDAYLHLAEEKGLTEPIVQKVYPWKLHSFDPPTFSEDFDPKDLQVIEMAVDPKPERHPGSEIPNLTDSDLEALSMAMKSFVSLAFANEAADK